MLARSAPATEAVSNRPSAGSVRVGRVVRTSYEPTNDELSSELSEAATEFITTVADATGAAVGAVVAFFTSSDTTLAVSSLGEAVGGVRGAAKAASAAWESSLINRIRANMRLNSTTAGGEWWVKEAFGNVTASAEVKESLTNATVGVQKAFSSLAKAGGAIVNPGPGSALALRKNVVGEVTKATVRLAKATAALVGRISGSDRPE